MIRVRNLGVTLGGQALLQGLDLDLAPGRITALVGESASGKSLAALAMIGLLPRGMTPEGRVEIDGQDILPLPERALCRIRGRRIGMVFQEPMTALNPLMTIGDQVAETVERINDAQNIISGVLTEQNAVTRGVLEAT